MPSELNQDKNKNTMNHSLLITTLTYSTAFNKTTINFTFFVSQLIRYLVLRSLVRRTWRDPENKNESKLFQPVQIVNKLNGFNFG